MYLDTWAIMLVSSLIISIVGIAFGYGILTNKVKGVCRTVDTLESNYNTIDKKLDDLRLAHAKLETKIDIALRNGSTNRG